NAIYQSEKFYAWSNEAVQQAAKGVQDPSVQQSLQSALVRAEDGWVQTLASCPREQDSYVNLAMIYNAYGRFDKSYFDKATAVAGRGLRIAPATPLLYLQLGAAEFAKGEYDLALKNAEVAASLDPHYVDPLYLMGDAHAARGDLTAAETAYRRVLVLLPGDPAATRGLTAIAARQSNQ
ncbi:MAG: tetratricopeptide repeat protein, partial [Actinobacteria bacterium]|nr:tetratricopeptide repeat protein [Actinomycetota bacterium]